MGAREIRRILLTADTAGGVWSFALELAGGLIGLGLDVCLVSFGPHVSDSQKRTAGNIRDLEWFHHNSKLEWMQDPWDDIARAGCCVMDVAQRYKPYVVHLNTLCHGGLPWTAPVVSTVHSCVDAWWLAVKRAELPSEWNRYRHEVKFSVASSALVTAPSHAALADVERLYGLDASAGQVIYNGRDSKEFRSVPKEPFTLSAGRLWDEAKNLRLLAGEASALQWPIFLAGDTRSPNGETSTFAGCHLLGELSTNELSTWYARASIYVMPARYEPFGLSALEAALSGCALVLGDIPSLREIWQDSASFVSPDDPTRLAAILQELINDPEHREGMSARAFNRAAQFTPSRMVSGYVSAYRSAFAKHRDLKRRYACAS